MESRTKVEPASGKHCVYTHFPKDPNCDICLKTKITRASCRRRAGTVVPTPDNFGDLITADRKILNEGKWIAEQSSICRGGTRLGNTVDTIIPVQSKNLPRRPRRTQWSFLEPTRKPKVIYTDSSLEFGKSCEELSWNHCTSTPHRSVTNGIAERAVRRVKEGTSAVLLQSGMGNELLSAKHARSPVWREDTQWKAVRDALWRTSDTTSGRKTTLLCERPI